MFTSAASNPRPRSATRTVRLGGRAFHVLRSGAVVDEHFIVIPTSRWAEVTQAARA